VKIEEVLELNDTDWKKLEEQEEYKKMKRRSSRMMRRQSERKFRRNIDKAFGVDDVEIIPLNELKLIIDENSFKKTGNLSNFPSEFSDWVSSRINEEESTQTNRR
jgi:hypothetical protein